jgi:hypothetical protein
MIVYFNNNKMKFNKKLILRFKNKKLFNNNMKKNNKFFKNNKNKFIAKN